MKNRAQSSLEYVTLIAIIGAALFAMQVYFKRGIQATVKFAADRMGSQQDAEEIDPEKGVKATAEIRRVTSGAEANDPNLAQGATQRIRVSADGSQRRDVYSVSEVKPLIRPDGTEEPSYRTYVSEKEE